MKNGLSENSDAVQNENSNILETTSPLPLPACEGVSKLSKFFQHRVTETQRTLYPTHFPSVLLSLCVENYVLRQPQTKCSYLLIMNMYKIKIPRCLRRGYLLSFNKRPGFNY